VSDTGTLLDPLLLGAKASELKAHLQSTVIGQDRAIEKIVNGMSPFFSGMRAPSRPIQSLLFLGSTGVGKTYCVEQLAQHVLGDVNGITRISCESFQERHEVSRLIGAPNGYIGYYDPAMLQQSEINKWRKGMHDDAYSLPMLSVILFDEIDKANESVHRLLLGILETGRLSLTNGKVTDFTKSIIVLTANWGSKEIARLHDGGFGFSIGPAAQADVHSVATNEAKKAFSPELWNRIDTTVVFNNLDASDIQKVCECELGKVQNRMREAPTPFLFSVSSDAKNALAAEGYSAKYGAREIKRVIERRLVQPLANLVASGQVGAGDVLKVYYACGDYVFRLTTEKVPWQKPREMADEIPADGPPGKAPKMWPYI